MTFDRQEYRDLMEKRGKERLNGTNLEMIAQAAVKAEAMTGDPVWDIYLSYIQAAIERMEVIRDAARIKMESPDLVDPNEIMAAKIALLEAGATIKAWEAVRDLPKDLKEQGKKAKDLLSRLDG